MNHRPRVCVEDRQSGGKVDGERWGRLATEVLTAEGVTGPTELTLSFVDGPEMAELNRRFLEGDGPTDVLAFPIDGPPSRAGSSPDEGPVLLGEVPTLLGDVLVCPAVANANAGQHAGSLDDELALLIVHGILHLLGHDHAEPEEGRVMRARERELLGRFHGGLAADPWS